MSSVALLVAAATALFFAVSLVFSMFGKGGGELYMVILVALIGLHYYTAAGITLFVLVAQGLSMLLVYSRRHKLVDWLLAFTVGGIAMAAAFLGGFVSGSLPGRMLKTHILRDAHSLGLPYTKGV